MSIARYLTVAQSLAQIALISAELDAQHARLLSEIAPDDPRYELTDMGADSLLDVNQKDEE